MQTSIHDDGARRRLQRFTPQFDSSVVSLYEAMDQFDYRVKSASCCKAVPTQSLTTTQPLGAHNALHPERSAHMQFLISITVIKTFHNLFVLFLSLICCSFLLAPSSRRANQTPTIGRFWGRSARNLCPVWSR